MDCVADVTAGLPFEGAAALFAEHFLEHLPLDEALAFLLEIHRVLGDGGRVRLSTPNLDWVLATHYPRRTEHEAVLAPLALNRSFYGWSHRFLWNRALLGEALAAAGFVEPRWYRHGESDWPTFRNLERHETYQDEPDLPHVLIVEARKGPPQPERLAAFRRLLREGFLDQVRPLGWAIDPLRSGVVAHLSVAGPLGSLVRAHVVRCAWVGGAVHLYPEAPNESDVTVDVGTHHLLADEPGLRGPAGLRRLPHSLRERVEAKVRGPGWLDVERWPLIRFKSRSLRREPAGVVKAAGELELRGRSVPLEVAATTTLEGDVWRARGQFELETRELGLPPWTLAAGLVRETGVLRVDFDLIAAPVYPT